MAKSADTKLTTPASLAVDAVLVVLVFLFFFEIFQSHVPASDPFWIHVWAAYGAACMTGVFWLALQMFRAVLRGERAAKAKK